MSTEGQDVRCDGLGCAETYPRFHTETGPGFDDGKWLGWVYLDLNRRDLTTRPLRFCGMRCLTWWLYETDSAWKPVRTSESLETTRDTLISAMARRGRRLDARGGDDA